MYGYDTISQMIRDPNLRASDADREATADRLRQHHTDGRIDQEEFQERLDRCYAAKTLGALAELTRDLPADPARRGSGGRTSFGLLGYQRMIPIVPDHPRHRRHSPDRRCGQRPVDSDPAVVGSPLYDLPPRIPRLGRSGRRCTVAARRIGRGAPDDPTARAPAADRGARHRSHTRRQRTSSDRVRPIYVRARRR